MNLPINEDSRQMTLCEVHENWYLWYCEQCSLEKAVIDASKPVNASTNGTVLPSVGQWANNVPSLTGTKFDTDKPRMELLSSIALEEIAKVLNHGAKKYAPDNWRKGIEWSRLLGAAFRHLTAFNGGEDKDLESGLSHLAHLGCCVHFLLEFEKTHKELDNRYKKP